MTIGRVAAAAGVSVETIRYYQRRGLLEEPAKPIRGYRRYPVEMVNRICFIKRAQVLGFTLADVAGLLRLDNSEACAITRELAAQKVALIEQKLSQLQTMRSALTKLVRQCDKKRKRSTCPIIEILQRNFEYQPAANGSSDHHNANRQDIFVTSRRIARRKSARAKRRTASDRVTFQGTRQFSWDFVHDKT